MDSNGICWRLHLAAEPAEVFALLSTDDGRARFWAESAPENDGLVTFRFANGSRLESEILENQPPVRFAVTYFGGSTVRFTLADDGQGGTDLTLEETGLTVSDQHENNAGWVAVLLALKAAADHGIDLRNHDRRRTWDQGFVDS